MTPTLKKRDKECKLPLRKILCSGDGESYDDAAGRVGISRETLRKVEFMLGFLHHFFGRSYQSAFDFW